LSSKYCQVFVQFPVKLSNFDGMSKSSAIIWNFWISPGNAAT